MAHEELLVSREAQERVRKIIREGGLKVRECADRRAAVEAVESGEADVVMVGARTKPDQDDEAAPHPLRNHRAYQRRLPELEAQYHGRYIAMYRGEVVGVGDEPRAALRAGIDTLGRPEALFVIKVGDPIPDPEPSSIRPDAPRRIVTEA